MKIAKVFIFTIFVWVVTTGCTVGALRVNSSPDKADVYLSYEGEQPNKIGQTPLNLDSRMIDENRGQYLTIQVKKEGFQTESMLVPTSLMKSSLDISSRLEEFKMPPQCQDQTNAIERIAKGIADVQQLVASNTLGDAQNRLNGLLNDFPNVSVLHDLMGNVHYLNKNLESALGSYQKSISLDPNNAATQRMVTKIRSIIGVRAPAVGEGR